MDLSGFPALSLIKQIHQKQSFFLTCPENITTGPICKILDIFRHTYRLDTDPNRPILRALLHDLS